MGESLQSKLRAVIEDEVDKDVNDVEVLQEANNLYDIGMLFCYWLYCRTSIGFSGCSFWFDFQFKV